jgi:hypothetical protein
LSNLNISVLCVCTVTDVGVIVAGIVFAVTVRTPSIIGLPETVFLNALLLIAVSTSNTGGLMFAVPVGIKAIQYTPAFIVTADSAVVTTVFDADIEAVDTENICVCPSSENKQIFATPATVTAPIMNEILFATIFVGTITCPKLKVVFTDKVFCTIAPKTVKFGCGRTVSAVGSNASIAAAERSAVLRLASTTCAPVMFEAPPPVRNILCV